MIKPWTIASIEVTYTMDSILSLVRGSEKFNEPCKVSPGLIDNFLYSGRFNSVLGLEGFATFKDRLKDVLKKVIVDVFGGYYINLDKMFEALLASGVYYLDEHLPQELELLKTDQRWLTAYRYIAKNFPDISYQDFREIVKRFQDTSGYAVYFLEGDSKSLLDISKHTELFSEVIDLKAVLLQLNQKQLRAVCKNVGAQASRSSEETVARIVAACGADALKYIPEEYRTRKSFVIKDTELATGDDIIHLDSYLRAVAKVVRQDLIGFIDRRRHWVLIDGGLAK